MNIEEVKYEEAVCQLKSAELILELTKIQLCPHILYEAVVIYDELDEVYRCVYETEDGAIEAVGDTPSQATDNFDRKWVMG